MSAWAVVFALLVAAFVAWLRADLCRIGRHNLYVNYRNHGSFVTWDQSWKCHDCGGVFRKIRRTRKMERIAKEKEKG